MIQVLLVDYKPSLSTLKCRRWIAKSTDVEELVENERYIGCGENMFDLNTFQVVKNSIDIFPKTRLNLSLSTNDVITDKIPPYFKQYMLQLANYDDDLQYFLFNIQQYYLQLILNTVGSHIIWWS